MTLQTKETLQKFVDELQFNDWEFHLRLKNEIPYLQIKFMAPCNDTGKMELQSCRKWMLSYHMNTDELISTAYKATEAAVLHEMREQFKWRGEALFHPHIDPQELWKLAHEKRLLKRDEIL